VREVGRKYKRRSQGLNANLLAVDSSGLDHGQARLKINEFLQGCRTHYEDNLARRSNVGLQQMAAVCSTVLLADHGMRMYNRFSIFEGNIADDR
jgi:hypothetical protein